MTGPWRHRAFSGYPDEPWDSSVIVVWPRDRVPVPRIDLAADVAEPGQPAEPQSAHSLSPGVYMSGRVKVSKRAVSRSTFALVQVADYPGPMSPTCTEKSGAAGVDVGDHALRTS